MSAEKQVAVEGGIGLPSLVFLVFLTLKLVGVHPVAGWSWWWVTAPLWMPAGIVIVLLVLVGIILGVTWIAMRIFERWTGV